MSILFVSSPSSCSPEALELLATQTSKRLPSFTRSSEASLLVNSLLRCCEHVGIRTSASHHVDSDGISRPMSP